MTPASASAAKELRSKGNSCCTYFKEEEGGEENIFSSRLLHNTSPPISYAARQAGPWLRLTHIIGYVQVLERHVFIPASTMQEGGLFNTEAGGGVANKLVAHYVEYNWG